MPTGFTVQVLDEMDPVGAALNDCIIPDGVPVSAGGPVSTPPISQPTISPSTNGGSAHAGECPCDQAQLGQAGCCNGQGAICDWSSNVPKLLGEFDGTSRVMELVGLGTEHTAFKPIAGSPCRAKRAKFYT